MILTKRSAELLIYLKEKSDSIYDITKLTDMHYSWACKKLKFFEEEKLIKRVKNGKGRKIILTIKGAIIQKCLKNIYNLLNEE